MTNVLILTVALLASLSACSNINNSGDMVISAPVYEYLVRAQESCSIRSWQPTDALVAVRPEVLEENSLADAEDLLACISYLKPQYGDKEALGSTFVEAIDNCMEEKGWIEEVTGGA